jgi:hypothetical protein
MKNKPRPLSERKGNEVLKEVKTMPILPLRFERTSFRHHGPSIKLLLGG